MPAILHGPFVAYQPQARQGVRKSWTTARKGTVLPHPEACNDAALEQMSAGESKLLARKRYSSGMKEVPVSVDLRKRIVDLGKKAAFAANKHGIEGQRAQVVLVLDISASMNALYKSGVIQRAIERILGLAVAFDDDGQIDLLLSGTNAYPLPAVTLEEIEGYVERVILARYKIREATNYAPPLRLLREKYRAPQPAPAFVIFLTDGGNADRSATTEVIRELSRQPVFVQFVGIGKEDFPFLRKLDELPGRLIDNAGFMQVNDLDQIKDAELYDRLLNEFPRWLEQARERAILDI